MKKYERRYEQTTLSLTPLMDCWKTKKSGKRKKQKRLRGTSHNSPSLSESVLKEGPQRGKGKGGRED